ncbi:MAG: AI-2E family transporter [Candidatus Pacebacteria bacterium]|nr:AI-2E family transporter [Candidatus Paceibacterota bacterium]
MDKKNSLHLDNGTILKVCLAVVLLYALYLVKSVIIWFIFALIIAILFNYIIDALDRKKIPRIISATVLYFGVFALIGWGIFKTAPLMAAEVQEFYGNLPIYLKKVSPIFEKFGISNFKNTKVFMQTLRDNLDSVSGSFTDALASIFGGASVTALVFAMAFFISLERKFMERFLATFFSPQHHEYLFGLWRRSRKKVSGWFISRLLGVVFVSITMLAILMVFNVKYAFLLAVGVGLLDFLPILGPLVAGFLLFAIVSLYSFSQAVFVVIAFTIIQELENHLLFPLLFKKFIGISPVLVLVAFAIGGELWGFAGGILAIPMAAVVYEIIKDYLGKKRQQAEKEIEPTAL